MMASLKTLQEAFDLWDHESWQGHLREEWEQLPPLRDRVDFTLSHHMAMIEFDILFPRRNPWLVYDIKFILACQWTTPEQKRDAKKLFRHYAHYAVKQKRSLGYVYFLKAGPYYKIGRTTQLSNRIKAIDLQMPFPIEIYAVQPSFSVEHTESVYHKLFSHLRTNGEWFTLNQAYDEMRSGIDKLWEHVFIVTNEQAIQGMMEEPIPEVLMYCSYFRVPRIRYLLGEIPCLRLN